MKDFLVVKFNGSGAGPYIVGQADSRKEANKKASEYRREHPPSDGWNKIISVWTLEQYRNS